MPLYLVFGIRMLRQRVNEHHGRLAAEQGPWLDESFLELIQDYKRGPERRTGDGKKKGGRVK